ncbi:MAG: methyltransferase domain-containing protein [Deltaproteobacteria bacterium]|nr:methyltransferase domain-containing protein [Deltaproteobacteria bacterium]
MDERDLIAAAEFCQLVESSDLLEYLGLSKAASPDECQSALGEKRKRLQSMQANPKYKDSAKLFLKSFRAFQRVLESPGEHLDYARRQREEARMPMLHFAIDSVLADGAISHMEEAFVRKTALELGISLERYQDELRARASAAGVPLPDEDGDAQQREGTPFYNPTRHSWWDESFTRQLLSLIPSGPGEMLDIYCRTGLSGFTLLPERPQLAWTGVDQSQERLEEAAQALAPFRRQVRLQQGAPWDLPLEEESMDYVLGVRALTNAPDTTPALLEAIRVLRPGGRLILAEPDGYGESFYFEGHLVEYNAAFHRLVYLVDRAMGGDTEEQGRPGMALGPKLPTRMKRAGLRPSAVDIHASANLSTRDWRSFSRRLKRYPAALVQSAGLPLQTPELVDVLRAVERLDQHFPADASGMGGHVLPLFIAVGMKD